MNKKLTKKEKSNLANKIFTDLIKIPCTVYLMNMSGREQIKIRMSEIYKAIHKQIK